MNLKENSSRNHESLHEYKDSNDSASIPDFQYPIVIDYAFYFPARRHYHYTNEMGAAGIEESGMIKESTDTKNDAIFGPGKSVTSC